MATATRIPTQVRISPALRDAAKSRAAAQGKTLQQWCEEAIRMYLDAASS